MKIKNIIIVTTKLWNINNFYILKKKLRFFNFYLISKREEFTYKKLIKINPDYIFFPHWSWIIPKEIWSNFDCVVFHMTDLPYGRGGTPLQNLIMRGHKKTKISAIKVDDGIDTGDIYIKEDLSLLGSAQEIYKNLSKKIFTKMIPHIIQKNPVPKKQKGKPTIFRRRKLKDSKIDEELNLKEIYDCIRMLDAESYPKAFLETKKLKLELSKVKKVKNKLIAKVEIYEK